LALRTGIEPFEIIPKSLEIKGSLLGMLDFVLNVKFRRDLFMQLLKHLTQNSKNKKKYTSINILEQTNPIVI